MSIGTERRERKRERMESEQQTKAAVDSSSGKLGETAAPAEKTLEHQQHFAEGKSSSSHSNQYLENCMVPRSDDISSRHFAGRSHGGLLPKQQPGNEGYPERGTHGKQTMKEQLGVGTGCPEQGVDTD